MTTEYLQVAFPEDRGVRVDGGPSGAKRTNVVLEIERGTHSVTLDPPNDFTPSERTIQLEGTTSIGPMVIVFEKRSPFGYEPSGPSGLEPRAVEPPEPWPLPPGQRV